MNFQNVAGQQRYGDTVFPQVVVNTGECTTIDELCAWVTQRREQLESELLAHGVVLMRGFPIRTAEDFDRVSRALGYPDFTYRQSLSNAVRINHTERVFTANEAPPQLEINLHNEMAQTPLYPERILFFCQSAAQQGGATPVCRCDRLFDEIAEADPGLAEKFEKLGVRYTTRMPGEDNAQSGQGRSWRSTLGVASVAEAEAKLQGLGYHWEWLDDGGLRATTKALPAVLTLEDGRKVFFNQVVAAYMGWEGVRENPSLALTFGDGSEIPREGLETVARLAEEAAFDVAWQDGDLALVNNYLAMHGRRPYSGERKRTVLVVLGAARENHLYTA